MVEVLVTLDPRQFGPKTFWHHQTIAEVSRHFGTSAEVSGRQFGTDTERSRLSSDILLLCYNSTMCEVACAHGCEVFMPSAANRHLQSNWHIE